VLDMRTDDYGAEVTWKLEQVMRRERDRLREREGVKVTASKLSKNALSIQSTA